MKVYALGVMQLEYDHRTKEGDPPSFFTKDQRLWSLYGSFEKAEEAMLNNYGDLFEYSYNLGLIEEVYVYGTPDDDASCINENRWWYLAEYTPDPSAPFGKTGPKVSKIECPEFFQRTVNFWVG
jgi:hypothetical protein